jgi:ABC-type transport system involved in multi-copper enzyme maturation permease subunit
MTQTLQVWLRRHVGWSNSRQSWEERLALLLLAGGTGLLVWLHDSFASGALIALWAGLILVGALLLRRGWLKLFGPVLFYDLVRISRRRAHLLLRWGYVMLLAVLIGWLYSAWSLSFNYREPDQNDIIQLNSMLFYLFMAFQFLTILMVTPAYTAGTIAEEKDRKTLEFLLATDLRNREIVLGKMMSRMFTILLIVLAGLPILSILQLLGGVGPDLALWSFAASVLTIAGLAGLSVACSTVSRRGRDAILLTYLAMFAYGTLSLGLLAIAQVPDVAAELSTGIHWKMPWPAGWRIDFTLQDIVDWLVCGNPVVAVLQLFAFSGGNVTAALPTVMPRYLAFHAAMAILFPAWAVWRLRPIAEKEIARGSRRRSMLTRQWIGRPRVGRSPMLWKELFVEAGLRFTPLVRLIFAVILVLLVFGSFVPLFFIVTVNSRWIGIDESINIWLRIVGTGIAILMLLFVAIRAAGSISGERDKQTFNELLTSPLSADTILFSKWLGAVLSVRWCWLWLGTIWLVGLVTGGLFPLAVPYLLLSWFIYAFGAAGVGLWFSAHSKTTLRAIVWTILFLTMVSVGHWIIMSLFCYVPWNLMHMGMSDRNTIEFLLKFEAGQTPPFVLGWFAFCASNYEGRSGADKDIDIIVYNFFGLVTWTIATTAIALGLLQRFRRQTNRLAIVRPQRRPARPRSRTDAVDRAAGDA